MTTVLKIIDSRDDFQKAQRLMEIIINKTKETETETISNRISRMVSESVDKGMKVVSECDISAISHSDKFSKCIDLVNKRFENPNALKELQNIVCKIFIHERINEDKKIQEELKGHSLLVFFAPETPNNHNKYEEFLSLAWKIKENE